MKRNNSYLFLSIIFIFYGIFISQSCQTVHSVNPVPDPEIGQAEYEADTDELNPDVSTLSRPEFDVFSLYPLNVKMTALPHLPEPESISTNTPCDTDQVSEEENLEIVSPELFPEKEDKSLNDITESENKNNGNSILENPEQIESDSHAEAEGKNEIAEKTDKTRESKNKYEKKKKKEVKKKRDTKEASYVREDAVKKQKKAEPAHMSEVYTHQGEDVEISFNSNGWIFAGYVHDADAEGVKYVSKDTTYRESVFIFKTIKTGSYDLEFILQDHSTGNQQSEVVRVHVVPDDEFVPVNSTDFISTTNLAEEYYSQGDYAAALGEYLKIYDESSPSLNEKIADLYEKCGQIDGAVPYWETNFRRSDDFSTRAAEKLLSYHLASGKTDNIIPYLDYLFNSGMILPEQDMLEIVDMLQKKSRYDDAISLLDHYLSFYTGSESRDSIYFLLAGLYENNSRLRDLKKAKYYYEKIISEYPGGRYARESRQRIRYLNRHFFHIH